MALSIQEKRIHFQNSENLLKDSAWENCVRSYNNQIYSVSDFYENHKINFKTKNWLDQSYLLYKNIKLDVITLLDNLNFDSKDYNRMHLCRNKKNCVIVIGDELLANFKETNIEKRLTESFAGQLSKNLDADLYASNINQIDNTSNSLLITKALDHLQKFNYEQLYLVFQISDPARCLNSLWWDPLEVISQNKNDILKDHVSYHFFPFQQMLELYDKEKNIDFVKDSLFFTLGKKYKNGYLTITPTEFYQLYEWSIVDLIQKQNKKYPVKIKTIFWKDFYRVCSSDLNIINHPFINFVQNKDNLLPFDSDNGDFVKKIVAEFPERPSHEYTKIYKKIPNIQKYLYNIICEPSETTNLLFKNPTSTNYGQIDELDLKYNYKNEHGTKWAKFILEKAGWLK